MMSATSDRQVFAVHPVSQASRVSRAREDRSAMPDSPVHQERRGHAETAFKAGGESPAFLEFLEGQELSAIRASKVCRLCHLMHRLSELSITSYM